VTSSLTLRRLALIGGLLPHPPPAGDGYATSKATCPGLSEASLLLDHLSQVCPEKWGKNRGNARRPRDGQTKDSLANFLTARPDHSGTHFGELGRCFHHLCFSNELEDFRTSKERRCRGRERMSQGPRRSRGLAGLGIIAGMITRVLANQCASELGETETRFKEQTPCVRELLDSQLHSVRTLENSRSNRIMIKRWIGATPQECEMNGSHCSQNNINSCRERFIDSPDSTGFRSQCRTRWGLERITLARTEHGWIKKAPRLGK